MPRKTVKKKPKGRKPPCLEDGTFVHVKEIAEIVEVSRRSTGLSRVEAAHTLNATREQVERAESRYYSHALRLRKRMLEAFAGYTIEGPFYQVRKKHE